MRDRKAKTKRKMRHAHEEQTLAKESWSRSCSGRKKMIFNKFLKSQKLFCAIVSSKVVKVQEVTNSTKVIQSSRHGYDFHLV